MSTTPLWHKEGTTIDEAAMAFMSKDDVFLEQNIDIAGFVLSLQNVRRVQDPRMCAVAVQS